MNDIDDIIDSIINLLYKNIIKNLNTIYNFYDISPIEFKGVNLNDFINYNNDINDTTDLSNNILNIDFSKPLEAQINDRNDKSFIISSIIYKLCIIYINDIINKSDIKLKYNLEYDLECKHSFNDSYVVMNIRSQFGYKINFDFDYFRFMCDSSFKEIVLLTLIIKHKEYISYNDIYSLLHEYIDIITEKIDENRYYFDLHDEFINNPHKVIDDLRNSIYNTYNTYNFMYYHVDFSYIDDQYINDIQEVTNVVILNMSFTEFLETYEKYLLLILEYRKNDNVSKYFSGSIHNNILIYKYYVLFTINKIHSKYKHPYLNFID